jgi:glycosyltransferase involved in cell wall biosynthesis
MRLTIITPSFNQGQWLEQTIISVLEQSWDDLEYMVIDGGSQDGSVEIIRRYEKYLAYWVSEPDNGQTDAINKGMKRATGEIVAYLNSDDRYTPGTLTFISNCFGQSGELDFLYGDTEFIDGSGKKLGVHKEIRFDYLMGCFFGFGPIMPQPSTFWRRKIFDEVGYFDASYHYNMDGEFFARAVAGRKVRHVDRVLSQTRLHSLSKTVQNINSPSKQHHDEHLREVMRSYKSLGISRFISFPYSRPLRWIYRLKRIGLRLLCGHYGKGYRYIHLDI